MHNTDEAIQYCEKFAELILPYFYKGERLKEAIRDASMGRLNLPRFSEELIAKLGGHKIVSVHFADLDDGSDVKMIVSGCELRYNGSLGLTYRYCLRKDRIQNKTGKLRVIGWNKLREDFDFFVVPFSIHKQYNNLYLNINRKTKEPNGRYARYRVHSLLELATR
jgi:hypothetical protein